MILLLTCMTHLLHQSWFIVLVYGDMSVWKCPEWHSRLFLGVGKNFPSLLSLVTWVGFQLNTVIWYLNGGLKLDFMMHQSESVWYNLSREVIPKPHPKLLIAALPFHSVCKAEAWGRATVPTNDHGFPCGVKIYKTFFDWEYQFFLLGFSWPSSQARFQWKTSLSGPWCSNGIYRLTKPIRW